MKRKQLENYLKENSVKLIETYATQNGFGVIIVDRLYSDMIPTIQKIVNDNCLGIYADNQDKIRIIYDL